MEFNTAKDSHIRTKKSCKYERQKTIQRAKVSYHLGNISGGKTGNVDIMSMKEFLLRLLKGFRARFCIKLPDQKCTEQFNKGQK